MAISEQVDLITHALWPQGDARDPLGVWGARKITTGDMSGGLSTKVVIRAPAVIAGAYIYTCYSAQVSTLSSATAVEVKCRLLTNWPDVDVDAVGVQGFATNIVTPMDGNVSFTAPLSGPNRGLIQPSDRFILLFDPRPVAGAFDIVEMEIARNIDLETIAFEAYGYYWDRGVLNAPGGPRHPGSM